VWKLIFHCNDEFLAYRLVSDFYITPSVIEENVYDIHDGARFLLKNIKDAHAPQLEQIRMKTSLPRISDFEGFTRSKSTTLLDLVNFGIECENPSEVFVTFRNELDHVTE
jgi:hypothetical protein